MSLRAIFDKEKTQSIKEVMPEELIVYKVALIVCEEGGAFSQRKYIAPYARTEYMWGEQFMQSDRSLLSAPVVDSLAEHLNYYPGFHSLIKKSAAEKYMESLSTAKNRSAVVLTCGVKKEWITAIGLERGRNLVVVSSRIVIPSYPHRDFVHDQHCERFVDFLDAQSQRKFAAAIDPKRGIAEDCSARIQLTYRQNRKHRELGRHFEQSRFS